MSCANNTEESHSPRANNQTRSTISKVTHHVLKVDERVALDGEESRGSNRSQSDGNRRPKLPWNRVRVNGNALDSLDRDITVLDGL